MPKYRIEDNEFARQVTTDTPLAIGSTLDFKFGDGRLLRHVVTGITHTVTPTREHGNPDCWRDHDYPLLTLAVSP